VEQDLFGSLVLGSDKKKVGKVLAPLEPKAIICIGLNYAKHAAESGTGQGAIHQQGKGVQGGRAHPLGPFYRGARRVLRAPSGPLEPAWLSGPLPLSPRHGPARVPGCLHEGTMPLEFSGSFFESLNGKRQSFPGEWSRKLRTHRSASGIRRSKSVGSGGPAAVARLQWPALGGRRVSAGDVSRGRSTQRPALGGGVAGGVGLTAPPLNRR
jgi:hypothetical protein